MKRCRQCLGWLRRPRDGRGGWRCADCGAVVDADGSAVPVDPRTRPTGMPPVAAWAGHIDAPRHTQITTAGRGPAEE
jgi:hypothetical protein